MREKIWMSWSTGKDSAMALTRLLADPRWEVRGLISTVNQDYDRVAMHGSRRELLRMQASLLNLPLLEVEIPKDCTNEVYEQRWYGALEEIKSQGVQRVGFGDLYLEDIRNYREAQLAKMGMSGVYPLWRISTAQLAKEILNAPIEAYLSCIDTRKLPESFVGRKFDASLLAELPEGVDPCGENGEFHTFVTFAPPFSAKISVSLGEVHSAGDFCFRDLRPM